MRRIAIDVDETLCSSIHELLELINSQNNFNCKYEDITDYDFEWISPLMSPKDAFRIYLDLVRSRTEEFKTFNKSKEIILALKEKYELFILTARNSIIKDKTVNWLNKNFGENIFEEILFLEETGHNCKAEVCLNRGFDLLIDDSPQHIINSSKKGVRVFAMTQTWNKDIQEDEYITRVNNWDEIYKNINLIENNLRNIESNNN